MASEFRWPVGPLKPWLLATMALSLAVSASYLDLGGQCWYVLGCDAKGRPIGTAQEIPAECRVMLCANGQREVLRTAPKRPRRELPFGVWRALAQATPTRDAEMLGNGTLDQPGLRDEGEEDS